MAEIAAELDAERARAAALDDGDATTKKTFAEAVRATSAKKKRRKVEFSECDENVAPTEDSSGA
jgi:hypothetical protein